MKVLCFLALFVAATAAGQTRQTPKPASIPTCVECHLALDDARLTPPAKAAADDVHARNGFTRTPR